MKGTIEENMVEGILEALPMEITILDRDDRIIAWNEREPRLFPRDDGIVGRDVRTCHTPESNEMIDLMLSEMKAGSRDLYRFWYDHRMKGEGRTEKILIEYIALRDSGGAYIGCMETMRRIGDIQGLKGERREPV